MRHPILAVIATSSMLLSLPVGAQERQQPEISQSPQDANTIAKQQAEGAMSTESGRAGKDEPGVHTNSAQPTTIRQLSLTDDERRAFTDGVKTSGAPVVQLEKPELGTTLPDRIATNLLPPGVKISSVEGLMYVRLSDRVLLVQPANRLIVGEIPL
jgi:hypothetical protein